MCPNSLMPAGLVGTISDGEHFLLSDLISFSFTCNYRYQKYTLESPNVEYWMSLTNNQRSSFNLTSHVQNEFIFLSSYNRLRLELKKRSRICNSTRGLAKEKK